MAKIRFLPTKKMLAKNPSDIQTQEIYLINPHTSVHELPVESDKTTQLLKTSEEAIFTPIQSLSTRSKVILTIKKQGIRVMLVGAIGPARDVILKSEIIHVLKKRNLFITSGDATDSFDGVCKKTILQKKLTQQNNP